MSSPDHHSRLSRRAGLERVHLEADHRAALARDLHLLAELEAAIAELEERQLVVGGSDPPPQVADICSRRKPRLRPDTVSGAWRTEPLSGWRSCRQLAGVSAAYEAIGCSHLSRFDHQDWQRPCTMALAQAAQHLATHPGTLGVFFRRLEHKKNRNVAVMATSRKLVVIAYELLSRGEPYRYAQPAPTAEKLRRLRGVDVAENIPTSSCAGQLPARGAVLGNSNPSAPSNSSSA
jgi:hypothetical protein